MQFLRAGEKVVLSSRFIDQLPKDNTEIRKFVDDGHAHLQQADLSTVRSTAKWEHGTLSTSSSNQGRAYGLKALHCCIVHEDVAC